MNNKLVGRGEGKGDIEKRGDNPIVNNSIIGTNNHLK